MNFRENCDTHPDKNNHIQLSIYVHLLSNMSRIAVIKWFENITVNKVAQSHIGVPYERTKIGNIGSIEHTNVCLHSFESSCYEPHYYRLCYNLLGSAYQCWERAKSIRYFVCFTRKNPHLGSNPDKNSTWQNALRLSPKYFELPLGVCLK